MSPVSPNMTVSDSEIDAEDGLILQELTSGISTAPSSAMESPVNEEQKEFDSLSTDTKLAKLDNLVQKSQVYSKIIAENLMANVEQKREEKKNTLNSRSNRSRLAKNDVDNRQPKLLSGAEMRDYQLDGLDFLVSLYENGLNGILADEMGLGKTIQCISFITFLIEQGIKGPFLIVVPLSTVGNWKNEFKKFAPKVKVLLYIGTKDAREEIRTGSSGTAPKNGNRKGRSRKVPGNSTFESSDINVVLTSYEVSIKDHTFLRGVDWKFLIVDEGHRLKNSKCLLIQKLKELNVQNRLLITGTPLQNNLNELWSLLNFILPDIFHDLELFQQWFNFDELTKLKSDRGRDSNESKVEEFENKLIELNIQKSLIENLHTILKPFILRRLKKDVIKGLPPKREYIVYVKLTEKQKRLYKECLDGKLFEALTREYFSDYLNKNFVKDETTPQKKPLSALELLMTGSKNASKKSNSRKRSSSRSLKKEDKDIETATSSIQFTSQEISLFLAQKFTPKQLSTKRKKLSKRRTLEEEDSDQEFEGLEEEEVAETQLSLEDLERKLLDDKYIKSLPLSERKPYILNTLFQKVTKDLRNRSLQNLLMQLRNICNSPYVFYEPFPTVDGQAELHESSFMELLLHNSSKMQVLSQLISSLLPMGHKVLIFSQFTKMLDLITDYFAHKGTKVCRLDGSTSQADRQETIDDFNTPEGPPIFLLSTRAGGLGINLTAADTVILFDSDWNPQIDLQAIDRAHRIGQTRPVKIYRFVMRDSIEEVLLLKSYSKIFLNKLIIQMNEHKTRSMEKLLEENIANPGALKESDELVNNLKSLIDLPKSFSHKFDKSTSEVEDVANLNKLSEEELFELLDRREECYEDKESNAKFRNISVFETVNNMET